MFHYGCEAVSGCTDGILARSLRCREGMMVPSGRKLPIFWDSFSHILAKKPVPSSVAWQIEKNLLDLNPFCRESVITLWGFTFFCFQFFLDKSMAKLVCGFSLV